VLLRFLGGGAQDNGTPICQTGQPGDFKDFTDGDGGWIVYHPSVANHLFVSSQGLRIVRHRPTDGWQEVSPDHNLFAQNEAMPWMAYVAIDQKTPRTLFTGTNRVWRTRDDGDAWVPVSPFFKGVISAIDVAAADSRRIYVGTVAGTFHRSTDGGTTWSGNVASAVLPGFQITRIESSPLDADDVIVTIAMFQCSHVFRSRDGGSSWTDLDRGRLPDVPHHSVAIPSTHPGEVYVANDVGVFVSPDFGETWSDLTAALPHVSVVDLVYHTATDTLYAARIFYTFLVGDRPEPPKGDQTAKARDPKTAPFRPLGISGRKIAAGIDGGMQSIESGKISAIGSWEGKRTGGSASGAAIGDGVGDGAGGILKELRLCLYD